MASDPSLEGYFEEAASWDADRIAHERRAATVAWRVAAAGWLCAVASSVALALLMPLKRVEPFVIRVNGTTGVVDVVPVYAGNATLPQAITRYFLTHYITVCERFDFGTAESDYQECGAFQTAKENEQWYARWNPNNPASPLRLYKDGTTVRAEVSSVSFFKRATGIGDLAQVRYRTVKEPAGGGTPETTDWIATVQYAYATPSSDPKTRQWNPLGFRIVDFETERETLPDAPQRPATVPPSATSGASAERGSAAPVAQTSRGYGGN